MLLPIRGRTVADAENLSGFLRHLGSSGAADSRDPENFAAGVRYHRRMLAAEAGHLVINEDIFNFFGAV
ncbi:hypothetical protein D3C75_954700 [compost metagenome]